ncbi:LppC protein [Candidatus Photodesmus katoptron Akat1]|uniref:LppC protein n=1 Tax=Candidatus Photodesmus katoptron Akat1 TaxID=1236703 RepID=S3E0T2_9GAMM|nr:LppC protein [Candidatus Photodesmus katoptron Akat1]
MFNNLKLSLYKKLKNLLIMKNYQAIYKIFLITCIILITIACSSTMQDLSTEPTLDIKKSTQEYLIQANKSKKNNVKNNKLIMALKSSINNQELNLARTLLKYIEKQSLSEMQEAEWQLAKAKILMIEKQPKKSLSVLNFSQKWNLPNKQWKNYHRLRAELFTKQNDYISASKELIKLTYRVKENQKTIISNMIWQNLNQYNKQEIINLNKKPKGYILDGWIQLTVYMKTLGDDIPKLKNLLKKWLIQHINHPAALYPPKNIIDILTLEIVEPTNIILLLPLSGHLTKQAQLIRNGFIIAMRNDNEKNPNARLTLIDTNNISHQQLKSVLIEKNIDFIIGPLTKEKVQLFKEIQAKLKLNIPILALNIPESFSENEHICYLTLSPEQEVMQGAKHLFEQGFHHPLILAPEGNLGNQVVKAFIKEWSQHSLSAVKVQFFGNKNQLQKNINSAFGLEKSKQNIAQIKSLTKLELKSQPRSYRDIDAVYIVANGSELTLIKPFIEVAINPDTQPPKIFSNSLSNNSSTQYEDLTGIEYSDIPWLINKNILLKKIWKKYGKIPTQKNACKH